MVTAPNNGRVAIIGGGLAGLSAAYHLPRTVDVTMFESSGTIGGRVRTARHLGGEEGAEFLLGCEKEIRRLVSKLGLWCEEIHDWGWVRFRGRFASGSLRTVAHEVLPRRSAERAKRVLALAPHYARCPQVQAERWLRKRLGGDVEAMSFLEMLLAAETCAPLNHLSARFILGCLADDRWYRIRGGTQKLANSLLTHRQLTLKLRARVYRVRETHGGVSVRWIGPGGRHQETFEAVVIATPDGHRLARRKRRGHFHSYVNVLLNYQRAWWNDESPTVRRAFVSGLYTDGPLNYVQQASRTGRGRRTLRILFPYADERLRWTKRRILQTCIAGLCDLSPLAERPIGSLVNRWREGLPCGGRAEKVQRIGKRVYLAGDRFGEWPSMNAAIVSGMKASRLLAGRLRQLR